MSEGLSSGPIAGFLWFAGVVVLAVEACGGAESTGFSASDAATADVVVADAFAVQVHPDAGEAGPMDRDAATADSDVIDAATGDAPTEAIDALAFLASLQFDGTDMRDQGETVFPVAYDFNHGQQDGNGDGTIDLDDSLENIVLRKIGNVSGTGRTGVAGRGPNDQSPAVYFHYVSRGGYDIYEYWLYFADNDWLNDHEHDWEKYFVYTKAGTPTHVLTSTHDSHRITRWADVTKDNGHAILSVEGGSHSMSTGGEDGVQIRYDGVVAKRAGLLDEGEGANRWVVYSNDHVEKAVSYNEVATFNYGDPFYRQQEKGDPRDAPWRRSEWNTPPLP